MLYGLIIHNNIKGIGHVSSEEDPRPISCYKENNLVCSVHVWYANQLCVQCYLNILTYGARL